MPSALTPRHSERCPAFASKAAKCKCDPRWRASVWTRDGWVQRSFATKAAAKAWRVDAQKDAKDRKLKPPTRRTLAQAVDAFFEGARAASPTVLARGKRKGSGRPYKPATLRGYEADLRDYWLPDFGPHRLGDLRRGDVQGKLDELVGQGLSPSRVRNIANSLRVIYRQAEHEDQGVPVNPTTGLVLPEPPDAENRAIEPVDLAALLATAPADLRPLWTTLAYTGLRLGEAQALRWSNVTLYDEDNPGPMGGWIEVAHGWDPVEGFVAPKSKTSKRRVPVVAQLRDVLADHRKNTGRGENDFVFGLVADRPFSQNAVRHRTGKAWEAENAERVEAGKEPLPIVGFHAYRHTCGAMLRACEVPEADISDWLGHAREGITARYTSAIEVEARAIANCEKLSAFIARGDTTKRIEQVENSKATAPDLVRELMALDPAELERVMVQVRAGALLPVEA